MRMCKYLLVFFSFIALAVNVQAETKRDSIQQVKDMDRYVFRDTLDNSYFIPFFEREWFYGGSSICSFG